ncbi:MAG: hypothetical protein H6937_06765 [Burkholderiales bacterium]|nr:hypothetical protein [Burkholderiales bacterium]MDR4516892.1 hypothetical protein [Nitrosomonas sp.]
MPINTIPAKPPFQPRMPNRPDELPDVEGKEFTVSSQTVDESGYIYERFVTVSRAQKWKRVFAATLECGDSVDQKITRKIGVSRTLTTEVSSKLGVSFEGLSAELGAKLGVSVTISEEDTAEFKATSTAPACKSRTYVVWQLVDIYNVEIIDEYYGWPPDFTFKYRFEAPLNVFDPDHKDFPNAECCTEKVALQKSEGFDCPFLVEFDDTALVVLGQTVENGRVRFADKITGEFQLGGLVPYAALSSELQAEITVRDTCPELTFGTVSLLDDAAGFYCNELNLVNEAGFERSQARILQVFNLPKAQLLAATSGADEVVIDRLIAARGDTGFSSLRAIENLSGFTRADLYQLVVPILTKGYLQLVKHRNGSGSVITPIDISGFTRAMLDKPLSDLPIVGPSTAEDIRLKLGAVNIGDLVAIGSETRASENVADVTDTVTGSGDDNSSAGRIFNPERLRTELIKADLRRGLTRLPESDIDGVIAAITAESSG